MTMVELVSLFAKACMGAFAAFAAVAVILRHVLEEEEEDDPSDHRLCFLETSKPACSYLLILMQACC